MQSLMQSEGMYNFALFLQFLSMILQPILYIAGIVTLIFVIRALLIYVKNNKPAMMPETAAALMKAGAEGSVFGAASAEEMAQAESADPFDEKHAEDGEEA